MVQMGSVFKVIEEYSADINAVQEFCNSIYDDNFAENFLKIRELYDHMKSNTHPITDEELEYILTTLPLELFTISERLNKIRLNCEVVKLKNKQKIEELKKDASAEASNQGLNKSQTNEYVASIVSRNMAEYEILFSAYNSVITRVENEQTFSKELIMGAKKVWDSRRNSEHSNPVGLVVPEDIPEYSPSVQPGKTPVFG